MNESGNQRPEDPLPHALTLGGFPGFTGRESSLYLLQQLEARPEKEE